MPSRACRLTSDLRRLRGEAAPGGRRSGAGVRKGGYALGCGLSRSVGVTDGADEKERRDAVLKHEAGTELGAPGSG